MFDLIGKTIGPYRVIEQIGVGGMATVYKAYQPSMDRYVAIKILPHYLSQDAEFVKRFQREARAIAKLEHAHILPVHDYGEYEGIAYIVMRYVEAGTLKERMARGQLPLDEIDRLVGQIGGALDYAHRLGVIHRDIKPGNVLLDTQGDTYLSDFGLARMMEVTQQLTGSGVGVGTPAYMSPEQGQGVKVDHRSDIYSLGVILYEMVTGRVPYEAETPMAVMIKHITDPLPLPRTVKPDVPEPIERVILRALAKNPADRFQTAGDMVQALAVAVRKVSAAEAQRPPEPQRAVETEQPSPTRADVSLVTRVGRLWEQPRGKVALVGGVVAVVLLLGFLLSRLPGSVAIVGPGGTATGAAIAQATPTSAPTEAPKDTATPTPTRTPAFTRTPAPTSTPTTHPAQTFAEPILAAIADRLPDYQDDFSDPTSGWDVRSHPGGPPPPGQVGYKDGEFLLIANPASAQSSNEHSFLQVPALWVSDFVMEFDARFVSALSGAIYVGFRIGPKGLYNVNLATDGSVWLETKSIDGGTTLAETRAGLVKRNQVNRIRIIAQGPQIALYLNGQPVLMARQELSDQGPVVLGIVNGASTPMQVNFDNFKVWDISDLPVSAVAAPSSTAAPVTSPTESPQAAQARAFAEPILAAIADRPPDYQDDFSDPSSGWPVATYAEGERSGEVGYKDGEYFLIADPVSAQYRGTGNWLEVPALYVSDFVMEFDARFVSGRSGGIIVNFRALAKDSYGAVFDTSGAVSLGMGTSDGGKTLTETDAGLFQPTETNRIRIIAQGPQFAVYLNDQPVLTAREELFDQGRVNLAIWNAFSTPRQVNFDNFKVWDISDLPVPTASP